MIRNLAYYRALPYEREWLPRDDDGDRYFVLRLVELPQVYGFGHTRAEARVHLQQAFDDYIRIRLEKAQDIPEPAEFAAPSVSVMVVQMESVDTPHAISSMAKRIRESNSGTSTEVEQSQTFRNVVPIVLDELERGVRVC